MTAAWGRRPAASQKYKGRLGESLPQQAKLERMSEAKKRKQAARLDFRTVGAPSEEEGGTAKNRTGFFLKPR